MPPKVTKEIDASDALKAFKGSDVKVQTATAAKAKGADGVEREGFITKMEPLAEEHVLSARDYGDRVVITTIDGQRHEAKKAAAGKAAA